MSRSTLRARSEPQCSEISSKASPHPSRIALPNGRVELDPPRKSFQIVSANVSASLSDWKPTLAPPPPRERVKSFPLLWQVWMSLASDWQLARPVPENVALSCALQIWGTIASQSVFIKQQSFKGDLRSQDPEQVCYRSQRTC